MRIMMRLVPKTAYHPLMLLIAALTWFTAAARTSTIALVPEDRLVGALSPKLRQFLQANPDALKAVTNLYAVAYAGTGRKLYLHYSYAGNWWTGGAIVDWQLDSSEGRITLYEKQSPLDEYVSLCHAFLYSGARGRQLELMHEAESGEISGVKYVTEMTKGEFTLMQKMQTQLMGLKLGESDTSNSPLYHFMVNCPYDYAGYLDYLSNGPRPRSPIHEYLEEYNKLRKPSPK
jgi:hypothetical protein